MAKKSSFGFGLVLLLASCSSDEFSSGTGGQAGDDAGTGAAGGTTGSGGAGGASTGGNGAVGGSAGAVGGAAGTTGGAAGDGAGGTAGDGTGGVAGAATGGAAGDATGGAAGAGTGGNAGNGGLPSVACVEPVTGLTCCSSAALSTVAWKDARTHCQSLGLDLAKAENNAKSQAIGAALSNANMWIGLTDQQTETQFVWVDGTPLGAFNDWAVAIGEPDSKPPGGHITQNCVFVSNVGKWFDAPCGGGGPYPIKGWCCE